MKARSCIWICTVFLLLLLDCCHGRECYSCRYSNNNGCDLKLDKERLSTTISCNNECFTQISRSSDGSDYEVIRGCHTSPVCYDTSYSVDDQAYIVDCCSSDKCNDNLSRKVFECMQCSDTESSSSTCPQTGFWENKEASLNTVYCSKFCEKEVREEDGTTTVTRSCVDTCSEEKYSAFGITTETYCCKDLDACNMAADFSVTSRVMVLLAMVPLIVYHICRCSI